MSLASDIVTSVQATMEAIKKVVYGTGLLTPMIQNTATELLAGQVPRNWARWWEGPEMVQAWLRGLVVRKTALLQWDRMSGPNLFDNDLTLADLFQPNVFLNALRQESARKLACSMDELELRSSFNRQDMPEDSITTNVRGLLLQGAGFDGQQLVASSAEATELVSVPVMFIAWVAKARGGGEDGSGQGSAEVPAGVPLYYSLSRERLLVQVHVPSGGRNDKWTVAGVALFLSDEE